MAFPRLILCGPHAKRRCRADQVLHLAHLSRWHCRVEDPDFYFARRICNPRGKPVASLSYQERMVLLLVIHLFAATGDSDMTSVGDRL